MPRDGKKKKKQLAGAAPDLTPSLPTATALAAMPLGLAAYQAGSGMFTPTDYANMKNFRDELSRMNRETTDPRQAIVDYSEAGARASNSQMFGTPLVDAIKTIRSLPGLPEKLQWQPNSGEHYSEFAKGPVVGYLQRLKEYQYDRDMRAAGTDQQWVSGGAGLDQINKLVREGGWGMPREYLEKPDVAQYLSWMGGYKPDSPSGVKNRDALFKLIQDIKPADQAAPTELPANYNNMVENLRGRYDEFSQKAGLPRLQDQTPKTQQGQLKAFDTYLKGADPELWRAKQLVDYTAGVGTAQGAINYYGKKLINPAFGLRNALLWGGGALAAGGAGYLLWRLLRKDTQEKTAETDEERRKRERLLTGAYAGGLGLAGLGLLSMNKTDLSRLEQFSQAADRWKANPDPRNDLRDYSALGHAAMQTKFMGNSASDILRFAGKNNPLVVKPWDDWKERHYKQFENSPLSAYLVRAREWSELPSETAETPTLSRLDSLQDPVKRFGADKLKDTSIAMAALPRSAAPYAVGEDYFKNYSKLVADTGGAIKPDPQFFAKLQRASNDYMAANKIDESTMPLAGQRELLNRIDAHIKQTDPELWKTKQWYDFDMGRASTIHSAQNYKKLMSPFMWFRKYAPMVGAITASVGAVGLLYYALKSRKSAKQKQPVVPVEAKLAEEKRTAWGRLAILALLAGGTGLAAHHLLANRNQPKPATPPAPETKPTAPDETPAPKPAEPVAAQPVETPKPAVPAAGPPKPAGPLDSFKSYWSSMPEWRRARAFQKLQDEFPEPDKFSELGWMQKQKLKLLAGQSERDQYGPTYAGLAKFVLYNPNREMLRGAFDIARADPGRDY